MTGLATSSVLTAVETKIPDVSKFVKKTNYNAKITGIQSNDISTADYNKFTDIADNNIKSKNVVGSYAIAGIITTAELNKKVSTIATKY